MLVPIRTSRHDSQGEAVITRQIGRDLAYVAFGLLFQAVTLSIIGGILVSVSALRGAVGMEWLIRVGLALELMGLMMLFLEYVGFAQSGESPLRWWVRSLGGRPRRESPPATWPRQAVVVLGVAAIVLGLILQLLGSFQ